MKCRNVYLNSKHTQFIVHNTHGHCPLKAGTTVDKYKPRLKSPDNLEMRPPKPNFIQILKIVSR
jgi:hypothetical protein